MMKQILFFVVLFSSLAASAQSRPAATPQGAITYFFDGLSALNDAHMRAYLTPDFLLFEDGAVWTADSLTKAMGTMKGVAFKRTNSFRNLRTEIKGATATLAYHNRADITVNGQPMVLEWLESAYLVRQGRGWKIAVLHSTKKK